MSGTDRQKSEGAIWNTVRALLVLWLIQRQRTWIILFNAHTHTHPPPHNCYHLSGFFSRNYFNFQIEFILLKHTNATVGWDTEKVAATDITFLFKINILKLQNHKSTKSIRATKKYVTVFVRQLLILQNSIVLFRVCLLCSSSLS